MHIYAYLCLTFFIEGLSIKLTVVFLIYILKAAECEVSFYDILTLSKGVKHEKKHACRICFIGGSAFERIRYRVQ